MFCERGGEERGGEERRGEERVGRGKERRGKERKGWDLVMMALCCYFLGGGGGGERELSYGWVSGIDEVPRRDKRWSRIQAKSKGCD